MSWSKRSGKICRASEDGGSLAGCPDGGGADPDRKPAGGAISGKIEPIAIVRDDGLRDEIGI